MRKEGQQLHFVGSDVYDRLRVHPKTMTDVPIHASSFR